MLQHIDPILSGVGMEIISENNFSSPNFPNLIITLSILNKNISFLTFFPGISFFIPNAWLYDRNIMMIFNNICHLFQRKFFLINCESFVFCHIINIRPNCVQWYFIILKSFYDFFQSCNILVTPSALMKSQRPEWRNCRSTKIRMKS